MLPVKTNTGNSAVSGKKKSSLWIYSGLIGFKLWLEKLRLNLVLEIEKWKQCEAGGSFLAMRRSGNESDFFPRKVKLFTS